MRAQAGQCLAVVVMRPVLAIRRHVAPVVIGHAHRNHQSIALIRVLFMGEVAENLGRVGRLGLGMQRRPQAAVRIGPDQLVIPARSIVVNLRLHHIKGRACGAQQAAIAAAGVWTHGGVGIHRATDFIGTVDEVTIGAGITQRVVTGIAHIPVPARVNIAGHLVQTADDVERRIGELLAWTESHGDIAQLEGLDRHRGLFFDQPQRGGAVAHRQGHAQLGQLIGESARDAGQRRMHVIVAHRRFLSEELGERVLKGLDDRALNIIGHVFAIREADHRHPWIGVVIQAVRIAVRHPGDGPGHRRREALIGIVDHKVMAAGGELVGIPGRVGGDPLQRLQHRVGGLQGRAMRAGKRSLLILVTLGPIVSPLILMRPGGAGLGLRHQIDGAGLAIQQSHGCVGQVAGDHFLAPNPFGVHTQHHPVDQVVAGHGIIKAQHVQLPRGVVVGLPGRGIGAALFLRNLGPVGMTTDVVGIHGRTPHGHRSHGLGRLDDGITHLLRHVVIKADVEYILEDPGAKGRGGVERRGM